MNYNKLHATFLVSAPKEAYTLSVPPYTCVTELKKINHRPDMKCEDFYSNVTVERFYSHCYHLEMKLLEEKLSEVLKSLHLSKVQEGHNGRIGRESSLKCIFDIARSIRPKNVCEIGFNAGHSALNWLVANANSNVYSWDIGRWNYTHKMMQHLQAQFPGRLTTFLGDSRIMVPKVARNSTFKCDIISIDGGHTFEVARADILNMKALAHKKTLLLVDDTFRNSFGKGIAKAFDMLLSQNAITLLFNCTYAIFGGFSMARYEFPI